MATGPHNIQRPAQRKAYPYSYQGVPPQPYQQNPQQPLDPNSVRAEASVHPASLQPGQLQWQPSYFPQQPSSYPPPNQSFYGSHQAHGGASHAPYQNAQQQQPHTSPGLHPSEAYIQRPEQGRRRSSQYSQASSRSAASNGGRRRQSRSSDKDGAGHSPHHEDPRHVRYSDEVFEDDYSDTSSHEGVSRGDRRSSYQDDADYRNVRRLGRDERRRQKRIDEIERRPTMSDSVMLVYDTFKGALTGRRD